MHHISRVYPLFPSRNDHTIHHCISFHAFANAIYICKRPPHRCVLLAIAIMMMVWWIGSEYASSCILRTSVELIFMFALLWSFSIGHIIICAFFLLDSYVMDPEWVSEWVYDMESVNKPFVPSCLTVTQNRGEARRQTYRNPPLLLGDGAVVELWHVVDYTLWYIVGLCHQSL